MAALARLGSDPAIRALPNASVVLSALSNEACAQWRHEWDEWQANGSATGARARSWQAHCADGGRIADFKAFREFGAISAVGVFVCFVCAVLFVPVVDTLWPTPPRPTQTPPAAGPAGLSVRHALAAARRRGPV